MGGRVSCFLFRTTVQKLLYFHYKFVHIFEAYALVGPFGGSYYHCIYGFSKIMKNMKNILFFISGPELLNGCTCMHKNLS